MPPLSPKRTPLPPQFAPLPPTCIPHHARLIQEKQNSWTFFRLSRQNHPLQKSTSRWFSPCEKLKFARFAASLLSPGIMDAQAKYDPISRKARHHKTASFTSTHPVKSKKRPRNRSSLESCALASTMNIIQRMEAWSGTGRNGSGRTHASMERSEMGAWTLQHLQPQRFQKLRLSFPKITYPWANPMPTIASNKLSNRPQSQPAFRLHIRHSYNTYA